MVQNQDLDIVIEESSGNRGLWVALGALAVVAAVVGTLAYFFYFQESEETELEATIEEVEVTVGALTSTLFTTGSAAASRRRALTFGSAGTVTSVEAALGDSLVAGQVLARLDDGDALQQVEAQRINLEQARIRLEKAMEPPTEAAIASANQSVVSARQSVLSATQSLANAEVQLLSANLDLEQLREPPTDAQIASADASIAQARSALERLSEPPTDAQIASADVAILKANTALERLSEPPTDAQIASADASIEQAKEALESLNTPPTEEAVASAEADVSKTSVAYETAARQSSSALASLVSSLNAYCDHWSALEDLCRPEAIPLGEADVARLRGLLQERVALSPTLTTGIHSLLQADAGYKNAMDSAASAKISWELAVKRREELGQDPTEQQLARAQSALESALAQRAALDDPPSPLDVQDAEAALKSAEESRAALDIPTPQYDIDQAQAALESALKSRAALDEPVSPSEIQRAEASIASAEASLATAKASVATAQASLAAAEANMAALMEGPDHLDVQLSEQDLRQAELSLLQAQGQLDDLLLTAPYDGVVSSVSVLPGDRVTASTAVFVFMDPASIGVDVNVSESDLVGLEPGQLALAQFDPIQDQSYLLRISGIDTDPTITQGVVTYTVRAEMVNPAQLTDRAEEVRQLMALVRGAGALAEFGAAALGGAPQAPRAAGQGQGGAGGQRGAALMECAQRVLGRVPQGLGDVTPEERARIQQECLGAAGASGGRQGRPGAGGEDVAEQTPSQMPTPGMSGSVTILTDIQTGVLLAPSAAIRQQGSEAFVYVWGADGNPQRKDVTIGGSDGDRTEVSSGLAEGDIVLMGAGLLASQSGENELTPLRVR